MKKVFMAVSVFAAVALTISLLAVGAFAQETVPKGTPEINAEMDEVWEDAYLVTLTEAATGTTDVTAEIFTLWDDEYLYMFADVKDSTVTSAADLEGNPWNSDSVELFLDEKNEKQGTSLVQFRIDKDGNITGLVFIEGVATVYGQADMEDAFPGIKGAARETEDGYIVEMAVPFTEITPSNGTKIGFEFQVNDCQDSTSQDATLTSVATPFDAGSYRTVTLVSDETVGTTPAEDTTQEESSEETTEESEETVFDPDPDTGRGWIVAVVIIGLIIVLVVVYSVVRKK